MHRPLLKFPLVLLTVASMGCGGSTKPDSGYSQATPRDVIHSLELSYERRKLDGYADLLADDFRFYLESGTRRSRDLPEFWLRAEDVAGTGRFLDAPHVTDVRIDLVLGEEEAVNEVGKENWRAITVVHAFIEVDMEFPDEPETYTFRVTGDQQRFYFRKGKSPDDVPPSPTADGYYIVDWRDLGKVGAPRVEPTPVEELTWTGLKVLDY